MLWRFLGRTIVCSLMLLLALVSTEVFDCEAPSSLCLVPAKQTFQILWKNGGRVNCAVNARWSLNNQSLTNGTNHIHFGCRNETAWLTKNNVQSSDSGNYQRTEPNEKHKYKLPEIVVVDAMLRAQSSEDGSHGLISLELFTSSYTLGLKMSSFSCPSVKNSAQIEQRFTTDPHWKAIVFKHDVPFDRNQLCCFNVSFGSESKQFSIRPSTGPSLNVTLCNTTSTSATAAVVTTVPKLPFKAGQTGDSSSHSALSTTIQATVVYALATITAFVLAF